MRRDRKPRYFAVAAFAGLLALTSGCGGGVGEVSGKITYKNKAVVYGSIAFIGPDGTPRTSRINPDGSYSVKDVAVGEAKIVIISELPAPNPGGRTTAGPLPADGPKEEPRRDSPVVVDPEVAKKWFPIPLDLGDTAKTKLRFTVKRGPNSHDIKID
jgi:hypothetical protein